MPACVCVWLARVCAAGWCLPLKMPFSVKKKKKYRRNIKTGLDAWVLEDKFLYGVLWSRSSFIEPLLGSQSPEPPKICLTDGSSDCES